MRKNDLNKLLSDLEGNPEIVLWNGYTSDFMHIDGLVGGDLVRMTWEHYLEMCRLEECSNRRDWTYQHSAEDIEELRKSFKKNNEWEPNEYVTQEDIQTKRYKQKRIVYINAKRRGKTMYDRLGSVSY